MAGLKDTLPALFLIAALDLALAPRASANVFEVFGANARARGMAGAMAATATDASAVWHNPAGLSLAEPSIGIGLGGAFDRPSILVAPRPRGYDPPDYALRLHDRADSGNQGTIFGVTLALTFKLLSEDLRAGVLIYFPSVGFAHASPQLPDERQQYFENQLSFELLDERLKSEVLAMGMSYRLSDWLSLGVGLKTLQVANNTTHVYTPNAADPGRSYLLTELEQNTETALVAGAMIQPWDFLRLGLSFHDEISFQVRGESLIQIRGQENEDDFPVVQPIKQVQHGSVPRFGVGAAYTGAQWTATLEGSWSLWSRYLGPDGVLARFDDTYSIAGGYEYQLRPGTWLRSGMAWLPSPVPEQTGRTNYVDNHRIVAALGAGNEFTVWDRRFQLDVGVQMHALLARQTSKQLPARASACTVENHDLCDEVPDSKVDTPVLSSAQTKGLQTGNPGFPGFSAGGYMLAAAVDVRWLF